MKHRRSRHIYTPAEDAIIRRLYPRTLTWKIAKRFHVPIWSIYGRANELHLKKDPIFVLKTNRKLGAALAKDPTSVKNRFPKGHRPANKGTHPPTTGRMAETQFKKGQQPLNTLYDGAIRTRRDHELRGGRAYKWIRIRKAVWKQYHVWLWEKKHGKVPRGKILVFKNRDSLDCRLSNLELIDRHQHGRNWSLTDGSMAKQMACVPGAKGKINRALMNELLQHPALIEAKRKQMILTRKLEQAEA